MFSLLAEQFDRASFECFRRDLDAKAWVILLHDGSGSLRGFSTLDCYESRFRGEPITVVYSGDTVVDEEAAGGFALSRTWIGSGTRPNGWKKARRDAHRRLFSQPSPSLWSGCGLR